MSLQKEYIKQWKHYREIYGSNTIYFMLVGKFYECYDSSPFQETNLREVAEMMNLSVSQKDTCLMAGFPEQSLQKFALSLTREGWTMIISSQKKNTSGAVIGRPVERIFSPGTHIEDVSQEALYLAGIILSENNTSIQAIVLDLTTGYLKSFSPSKIEDLQYFFQIHQPKETIIWWDGAKITQPEEMEIRKLTGIIKTVLHIKTLTKIELGTFDSPFVRKEYLEGLFIKTLSLLPIKQKLFIQSDLQEKLLVLILNFAETHFPEIVKNLQNHSNWSPESSVYLGNNALLQLNYISNVNQHEQSIFSLFKKTLTSLGRRAIRERLLMPSSNIDIINKRLNEVEYYYNFQPQIEQYLRLIQDLPRIHRKIMLGRINAQDCIALDSSYMAIFKIIPFLADSPICLSDDNIQKFNNYYTEFKNTFDIEKAKLSLEEPEDLSFLPVPSVLAVEKEIAEKTRANAAKKKSDDDYKANLGSTLDQIATLQTSGSKTLGAIGKAAALAQISISGSVAVTKALELGPILGPVAAAAVGASIAAQAAKVAGVAFAGGGFINGEGGATSGPDNTMANLRKGEMVLNSEDQKTLFDAIKGGGLGGGGNIQLIIDGREIAIAVRNQINSGFRLA